VELEAQRDALEQVASTNAAGSPRSGSGSTEADQTGEGSELNRPAAVALASLCALGCLALLVVVWLRHRGRP
jgi:hypothetical protein